MNNSRFLADLIGLCIECRKVIKPEDKTILIYEEDDIECVVHEGECHSRYSKFLTDPAEIARGSIIGLCEGCAKPVRWSDKFVFMKFGHGQASCDTTVPQRKSIGFMHTKCADELN